MKVDNKYQSGKMPTMTTETTTKTEPMRIKHVQSQRIDRRRNREYRLELELFFSFGDKSYCSRCLEQNHPGLHFRLDDVTQGLPYLSSGRYSTSTSTSYSEECEKCKWTRNIVQGLSIKFHLPADRPSDILSESQAQKRIASGSPENKDRGYSSKKERPLTLEQILTARVEQRFGEWQREMERSRIAQQGCRIAAWLAEQADKEAREEISFTERLEALKAELKQAQARRMNAFCTEGKLAEALEKNGEEWAQQAIGLGIIAALKLLPAPISSPFDNPDHRDVIKPGDVRLPGDPEPEENITEKA